MKKMGKILAFAALSAILIMGCQDGSSPVGSESQNKAILQNAEIGNYVWIDENMDGIQDDIEMPMGGVTVNLYNCEDSMLASTTTDDGGNYAFEGLDAGDYMLEFLLPEGYVFTLMNQGDNDEIDSDVDPETGMTECFTVEEDSSDASWDAGIYMVEDEGCTYGKGFWKNHTGMGPQEDLVTDLLPIWLGDSDGDFSLAVETAEMAYNILQQHEYGHPSNGITRLYAHLLAAKLNVANGASDEDIAEAIDDADAFLAAHDWEGWEDLEHEDRQTVNDWKDMFEDYNEGEIGPGSCDSMDDMY